MREIETRATKVLVLVNPVRRWRRVYRKVVPRLLTAGMLVGTCHTRHTPNENVQRRIGVYDVVLLLSPTCHASVIACAWAYAVGKPTVVWLEVDDVDTQPRQHAVKWSGFCSAFACTPDEALQAVAKAGGRLPDTVPHVVPPDLEAVQAQMVRMQHASRVPLPWIADDHGMSVDAVQAILDAD